MTPEFSRPQRVDRIPSSGILREIAAEEDERRALAGRFGIVSIDALSARVALTRTAGGDVGVSARIAARVVQECVVTLDPVDADIDEEVTLLFRPVAEETLAEKTVVIPADEDFEPFAGESLDIGEIVAVELALRLDPFPRSSGADAAIRAEEPDETVAEDADSPFRVLEGRTETG